jgi:NADH-quinone oxidoreductase subunit G
MQRIGQITPANPSDIEALAAVGGTLAKDAFAAAIDDFYMTNPIARASAVMAECSVIAEGRDAQMAAE